MFKVGIFVARKGGGEKLLKWLPTRYASHAEADAAVVAKNRDLGVCGDSVAPGRKFAMYDAA